MKTTTLALALALVLSGGAASANSYRHHHHHGWSKSMNMMRGPGRTAAKTDPNGTASGSTSLSGTGPSTYGGNNPGAPGSSRQPR